MVSPLSVNERLIAHVAIPMKRIPSNSICSTMSHEENGKFRPIAYQEAGGRKEFINEEFRNVIKITFICHGNICRSTMAESVFTELVRRAGREAEFVIDSAATSTEEIGNPPHHGTVAKLREVGIPVVAHRARQVRRAEYGDWDHIVYMDAENAHGLRRIFGDDPDGKITRLLDWTEHPGDVADPWYTGNFDATYRDVLDGCTAMLEQL